MSGFVSDSVIIHLVINLKMGRFNLRIKLKKEEHCQKRKKQSILPSHSYGDELEIQYFEEKFGKWILKEGDIDSRPSDKTIKVTAVVDGRCRYTFSMLGHP